MASNLPVPPWLSVKTAELVRAAAAKAQAQGRCASTAARDVAWCNHPALPAPMIYEAVDVALGRSDD